MEACPPNPAVYAQLRIPRTLHQGFENRTCAVFDALCVCEPRSGVIVIGCRLKEPTVELVIASNNGPPP